MTRIILTTACVLSMACSSSGLGQASAPEQAAACAGGVVRSDTELERYETCTEISGHLELQNVTSLAPLQSVRRVEGTLRIQHTRKLYTLSGLESLRSVGRLELRDNAALIYGGALRSLEHAPHVSVSDNPRLSAHDGLLASLGRAAGEVTFSGNWGLAAEGVTQSPDRQVVAVR